jgi:hypothetical protein
MIDSMNISSARYASDETMDRQIICVIDGITMFVPLDPANRHYAEIMRQVEAGELTIEPADEPE